MCNSVVHIDVSECEISKIAFTSTPFIMLLLYCTRVDRLYLPIQIQHNRHHPIVIAIAGAVP